MSPSAADKAPRLVSLVDRDVVVETIAVANTTAFAIMRRGEECRIASEFAVGGRVFVPISATNNLIKHRALLFPPEPADYEDADALLADVIIYIRRYVSLPANELSLTAAYILLTWVYDAFNELPYLRFRGDYGTGKTRALLVVGSLCYKAFFASGASTISPIFHTLDTFRGTLIFDEADFRFTDEKAELVKILNNGNVKGFPVLRTQVTARKEFDPRAFAIFGPKIVGMRRSYADKALESRFLTVEMEPGRATDTPINLPDAQAAEAAALRAKLLMFRLQTRLSLVLDPSHADAALEPRLNQIVLPLLSVPIDEAARAAIRAAVSGLQHDAMVDRAASAEGQVLSVLGRLLSEHHGAIIALSDIAAAFASEFGDEYEHPVKSRWIGAILRQLGFALYKRNGLFVVRPGQVERLRMLSERYGLGPIPPEPGS